MQQNEPPLLCGRPVRCVDDTFCFADDKEITQAVAWDKENTSFVLYNPVAGRFVTNFPLHGPVPVVPNVPLIYRRSGLRAADCRRLLALVHTMHTTIVKSWSAAVIPKNDGSAEAALRAKVEGLTGMIANLQRQQSQMRLEFRREFVKLAAHRSEDVTDLTDDVKIEKGAACSSNKGKQAVRSAVEAEKVTPNDIIVISD